MTENNDRVLIQKYLDGDGKAFEVLFNRYRESVFRFILGYCGNYAEAEDLFQELFIKLLRGLENFKGRSSFRTYLYTSARNCCIDRFRKNSRKPEIKVDDEALETLMPGRSDAPSKDMEQKETGLILRKALEKLPPEQREVFLLKEESGTRIAEIAEILGCPENTVKSRLRYAVLALRDALEPRLKRRAI